MDKISVIVPVYNAEPYLQRCLESVTNQTYKNLEIILVNDGSIDLSSKICEDYAKKDERITVIHTNNKGVASARNMGMSIATGEWIGWVDADDWVELDMFEYLIKNARTFEADIAICDLWEERIQRCTKYKSGTNKVGIFNKEEALKLLIQDNRIKNYLWNKLWKRSLFEGIAFPEQNTYEDVSTTYRIFVKCTRIILLPGRKYHYCRHKGSIQDNQNLINKINYYRATKVRRQELEKEWPNLNEMLRASCIVSAIGVWAAVISNSYAMRLQVSKELEEIAELSKENYIFVCKTMKLGIIGKTIAKMTKYNRTWAFFASYVLGLIYKMIHGTSI